MNIINSIDDKRFSINGVEHFKNFIPLVIGDKLKILNNYDSKIQLTDLLPFNEFTVSGNVFSDVLTLQSALLPILYTRGDLNGGSGGANVDALKKPQVLNYTVFGVVPTLNQTTNDFEVVTFLNQRKVTTTPNSLMIIRCLVKRNDSVVFRSYFFAKNNIPGTFGTGEVNGEIVSSDLISNYEEPIQPTEDADTITIALGDIGTDTIVDYLNNNPMPTSGQNWELLDSKSYFFTYTSNSVDITDFYIGDKPATLGNQAPTGVEPNKVVETSDFQRISTDGVQNEPDLSLYVLRRRRYTNTNVSGVLILDVNKYDTFDLTLTGATTLNFASANNAEDSLPSTIYLTGDFALTYPDLDVWSGEYDGTTANRITAEYKQSNQLVGDIQTQ